MYTKGVSNCARIQALKDELCQVLLQHFKILPPPLVQSITVLPLVNETAESALTSAVVQSGMTCFEMPKKVEACTKPGCESEQVRHVDRSSQYAMKTVISDREVVNS